MFVQHEKKSNLHYSRSVSPKRVTCGGIHLRCGAELLAAVSDLTGPGIEALTSRTDVDVYKHQPTGSTTYRALTLHAAVLIMTHGFRRRQVTKRLPHSRHAHFLLVKSWWRSTSGLNFDVICLKYRCDAESELVDGK